MQPTGQPLPGSRLDKNRLQVVIIVLLAIIVLLLGGLLLAQCGDDTTDANDQQAEPTQDDTAVVTTEPPTTTAVTETPTTTPVQEITTVDCDAVDGILGLLWNDWAATADDAPAFGSFSSDLPNGQIRVTAYDPSTRLLAAIWEFNDPQGDGLAQGIVWLDGEIIGDVYYLDGVDPIVNGDSELLETRDLLSFELGMDGGKAIAIGCSSIPKPPLISNDRPLTIHGISPITAGMTLARVIEAIGEFPYDLSEQLEWADGYCYVLPIEDTGLSLQLEGLGPDASPLEAIVGAVIVDGGNFSTPSGMALGTSQANLEAALGDQLDVSPHAYISDGSYHDFVPNDADEQHLRLRFVITGGVITEMRAGLQTSTSSIEGCS